MSSSPSKLREMISELPAAFCVALYAAGLILMFDAVVRGSWQVVFGFVSLICAGMALDDLSNRGSRIAKWTRGWF